MHGSLFVISAPSGTGKTSLVKALTESDAIRVAVSHTTRPKRQAEVEGFSYYFTNPQGFKEMIQAEAFVEYAEVFGHYYGTSKAAVMQRIDAGQDIILEIDWQGALQVRKLYPEAQLIFILPPSLAVLEQRLRDRNKDSEAVIAKRLAGALTEMRYYKHYDYLLVNDDFVTALNQLRTIVQCSRLKKERQEQMHSGLLDSLFQFEN